jgi:tRNA A-37 threonylcarbamoyl transferase component Bud32
MNEAEIRERIREYSRFGPRGPLRILADTSDFMRIGDGDVLELDGRLYLVRGEEFEGRFGLDGEPKFWVKRAIDLEDGSAKIIKLVFYENFVMQLGAQPIRCYRSPRKEARILRKVRGHPRFMQGIAVKDTAGNDVRIIDRIRGHSMYQVFSDLELDHRTYFFERFPAVFAQVVKCVRAIADLHDHGEVHGDIRNDHILIERGTGRYAWIDFDYAYEWGESPFGVDLFGLGNIVLFTAGKGFYTLRDMGEPGEALRRVQADLAPQDFSLFFPNRLMNLRKLFPYIPESLSYVLMHFSQAAEVFYETAGELLADLVAAAPDVGAEVR